VKIFALAMALVLTILISSAVAKETHYIQGESYIGCIDQDEYKELIGYAVDKDEAAFEKALYAGLLAGTMTMFEEGEPVYLEDTSIWSGLVQVRRPGETEKYWTAMEAID
jgi:hypothetical protein